MGSLNLCLEMPDSLQKESAQSDYPALRKRPKGAKISRYFDIGPKQQNRTAFWLKMGRGLTKVNFQSYRINMLCTLNLYLRMPDSLQKELAQSDHGGLRKRPKCVI